MQAIHFDEGRNVLERAIANKSEKELLQFVMESVKLLDQTAEYFMWT